jgi:hypothetical protein
LTVATRSYGSMSAWWQSSLASRSDGRPSCAVIDPSPACGVPNAFPCGPG